MVVDFVECSFDFIVVASLLSTFYRMLLMLVSMFIMLCFLFLHKCASIFVDLHTCASDVVYVLLLCVVFCGLLAYFQQHIVDCS